MRLKALEIKNYRSLEHVLLDDLRRFNVLIGRNNSGKSTIFGALTFLHAVIHGQGVNEDTAVTARERQRSLELRLLFDADPIDREGLVGLIGGKLEDSRKQALLDSGLFRQVEFLFKSPSGHPRLLHLRQTRLLGEDGQWGIIQEFVEEELISNPQSKIVFLTDIAPDQVALSQAAINVRSARVVQTRRLSGGFARDSDPDLDPGFQWIRSRLAEYFTNAFFFNPFRHSILQGEVEETRLLAQDGANLAQVLLTIASENRNQLLAIEQFLHSALPDIGYLQTPIEKRATRIAFRLRVGDYLVPLSDMGGGVEQLLMVATVLFTTGTESAIFLEEPESHLHAGAQRFLLENLQQSERQIFLTTHSPTFINTLRPHNMYQVRLQNNRTAITHLKQIADLGMVLEDIGSRNSDVLLSDAVLFVEGPGDQHALQAWSQTLGQSLEEHNITAIPLGGGDQIARGARLGNTLLTGISQKAQVPHLFILDRDERSQAELAKLQKGLQNHIHILEHRELENYLLVPRALLEAIRIKHRDDARICELVAAASHAQVASLMQATAAGLYGMVLLKRIRAELGGIQEGLLPRGVANQLAIYSQAADLAQRLRVEIEARIARHLEGVDFEGIVHAQRDALDAEWAETQRHISLAPGEEIVAAVFHQFGTTYTKPKDTERIARAMTSEEIADEIKALINWIVKLTDPSS